MSHRVPRMNEVESEAWLHLVTVLELLPVALDTQLQRDSDMTHFEFVVLSSLRLATDPNVRMKALAASTNATLPRLSHVVSRLEARGLVERSPCPEDRRATNVALTTAGRAAVVRATPGHIATVRKFVIDALTPAQLGGLSAATGEIARRLDPGDRFGVLFDSPEETVES